MLMSVIAMIRSSGSFVIDWFDHGITPPDVSPPGYVPMF